MTFHDKYRIMLTNVCSQHLFYGTEAETMPPDQSTLKNRLAHALFGDIIQGAVAAATASVSVRVDDTPGWNRLAPAGPHDRDLAEWYQDQEDALEAWRKNFLIRRIVTLARSYVLGVRTGYVRRSPPSAATTPTFSPSSPPSPPTQRTAWPSATARSATSSPAPARSSPSSLPTASTA